MRILAKTVLICCLLSTTLFAQSDPPDLIFGPLQHDRLQWGTQPVSVEVTNNSDYLKYLVVENTLAYDGEYLSPSRSVRFNFVVLPAATSTITFNLEIPGNFGAANGTLKIFDVIDTLDEILPGQEVLKQPYMIRFPIREEAFEYTQERLSVPPRVGGSREFDHEFARLVVLLLDAGKSIDEIAAIGHCRPSYVQEEIDRLAKAHYLRARDYGSYEVPFPVIHIEEAKEVREVVHKTSAELVAKLAERLDGYDTFLEGLASEGVLSRDKYDLMDGGIVLYNKYATVAALLLWFDLGQEFISDPLPLEIYGTTDPCNARIPAYMHLVQGGSLYTGTNFYHLTLNPLKLGVLFGEEVPEIGCADDFWTGRVLQASAEWWYDTTNAPELFSFDSSVVYKGLRYLRKGSMPILEQARADLSPIAEKFGHDVNHRGYKYWFWNQVATETISDLRKRGLIPGRTNGHLRIETFNVRY